MDYFYVALGSAFGGVMRYFFSGFIAVRIGEFFPWGTLFCNVSGSFLIGVFAALGLAEGRWVLPPEARQLV